MSFGKVPSQMRAAILEEFNKPYQFRHVKSPPHPQDHDLLLQVLAASYCHTDAVYASGAMWQELPRINCHEFAGRIVAMGSKISPDLNLSIGQEVGVPGRCYRPCGECYECKVKTRDPQGYSPYCPRGFNMGTTCDGGFQEYVLVDSRQVGAIPKGMSAAETAPLMCAGLTIWSALQRVEGSSSIAILGAGGGLGHLGVQFAAHLGKKVLAIDAGDKPLELLKSVVDGLGEVGQDVAVIDARKSDAKSASKSLGLDGQVPGESGVDATILLPESQTAFDFGMSLLRNHGTMVILSFPEQPLKLNTKDIVFRDIRIVGSLMGRNFQLREMLEYAAEHHVRAVTRKFPFERLNELVQEYHKGFGGKLIVEMTV